MKNFFVLLCLICSVSMFSGCTANDRAKRFGGTMKVELLPGKKFVNATWKTGGHLWYITRDMHSNDIPETFEFKESSNFGILEGTVVFIEKR